jgi:predicted DNA-binding transcriptional regulator AlpA
MFGEIKFFHFCNVRNEPTTGHHKMTSITHTTQVQNLSAEFILSEFSALRSQLQVLTEYVKPKESQDEYLTRDEVAAFLKVSKVTVWQWSKPSPGILNVHRIGNKVRYLKSEVIKATKSGEKGGFHA